MKHLFIILFAFSFYANANSYGNLLLQGNCITCHHPTKNISAPSLSIIKVRYLKAFPKKEDFVEYMSTWILNPDKNTSLMSDMIDKYGLMPQLGYDKYTLKIISEYVYSTHFSPNIDSYY